VSLEGRRPREHTIGDSQHCDCPVCGEPGLNDLWDGGLTNMHDGDTNTVWCGRCDAKVDIVLHVAETVVATPSTSDDR
jgi:hypothetical protein